MKYATGETSSSTPGVAEQRAVYNMHDAKSNLSRLVEQAAAGQEIIIAKAGKPAARLVQLLSPQSKTGFRELGIARGKFEVPSDFDEPLPGEMWGDLFDIARPE